MDEQIEAVKWMFGLSKSKAITYIEDADPLVIEEIVKGFRQQVKMIFEED